MTHTLLSPASVHVSPKTSVVESLNLLYGTPITCIIMFLLHREAHLTLQHDAPSYWSSVIDHHHVTPVCTRHQKHPPHSIPSWYITTSHIAAHSGIEIPTNSNTSCSSILPIFALRSEKNALSALLSILTSVHIHS